jgi:hypothetical protein
VTPSDRPGPRPAGRRLTRGAALGRPSPAGRARLPPRRPPVRRVPLLHDGPHRLHGLRQPPHHGMRSPTAAPCAPGTHCPPGDSRCGRRIPALSPEDCLEAPPDTAGSPAGPAVRRSSRAGAAAAVRRRLPAGDLRVRRDGAGAHRRTGRAPAPPPAPGWLQVRFQTRLLTGEILEEDGEIRDSRGELVAVSRRLALLLRG